MEQPKLIRIGGREIDPAHVDRVQALPTGARVHMRPGMGEPVEATFRERDELYTACTQRAVAQLSAQPDPAGVALPPFTI